MRKLIGYLQSKGLWMVKCCQHTKAQIEELIRHDQVEKDHEIMKTKMYQHHY
ncbi:hypothetical protein AB3N04_05280 [Alkalihalophilus sp. As8PL]|uniref:Uncharacterized protein n=1 Tax=Alkalihalophilus sp. As8PL TaxID=3237103 RepID=A0AB39BWC8_9BACI